MQGFGLEEKSSSLSLTTLQVKTAASTQLSTGTSHTAACGAALEALSSWVLIVTGTKGSATKSFRELRQTLFWNFFRNINQKESHLFEF